MLSSELRLIKASHAGFSFSLFLFLFLLSFLLSCFVAFLLLLLLLYFWVFFPLIYHLVFGFEIAILYVYTYVQYPFLGFPYVTQESVKCFENELQKYHMLRVQPLQLQL